MVLPNYDVINALSLPEIYATASGLKGQRGGVQRWRSGCGYTQETNARIRISTMRSPLIDAGIVGKTKTVDSTSVKFDPVRVRDDDTGLSQTLYDAKEQSRFK
jgi:hypothetical protein